MAMGADIMKKHSSANPRRNFTEMLHVLGEHTGVKTELYQTNVNSQGFIQHRLHLINACSKRLIRNKTA